MEMKNIIDKYISEGYVEISTDSGTGSTILVNDKLDRVIKINQDVAYNEFIDFIQKNNFSTAPIIYDFKKIGKPPYEGNHGFTVVLLEKLTLLTNEESDSYIKWISNYWGCKRKNTLPADEFGLLEVIELLVSNAKIKSIGVDLGQSTNVMKRSEEEYVVTDPYN